VPAYEGSDSIEPAHCPQGPAAARQQLCDVYPPPVEPYWRTPPDLVVGEEQREREYLRRLEKTTDFAPYSPGGAFSFYHDLLVLERARRRTDGTAKQPRYQLGDPGPGPEHPFGAPTVQAAQQRLVTVKRPKRDITSGGTAPFTAPALPTYLLATWGRASAQVSGLLDAFEHRPAQAAAAILGLSSMYCSCTRAALPG
jgi:hypothetical protein